ncbi:alpha/beta hydrolase [Lentzea sp. NPDC006480]|uniref:alpha/beta hydrolase n=1 Tax=Lentzea sp. NPDC006480 TaxID=3157176 RepID=UPI0033B89C2A
MDNLTTVAAEFLVRRVVDWLHLPLLHEAKALAQRAEIKIHPLWTAPSLDAQDQPLLLIGGLCSTAQLLEPLHDLMVRLNFRCQLAPTGLGIGCGEALVRRSEDKLERLVHATGRPAIIVGHSRGGQIGRVLATRRPDLTRGLITLGSPLTRLLGVNPWLFAQLSVIAMVGSLGVPGLLRASCGWGSCCAQLRRDLAGIFPGNVPFTSIYSRGDRIVDWRSCLDPAARHREVDSAHGALTWSPRSLVALVDELTEMLQQPEEQTLTAS